MPLGVCYLCCLVSLGLADLLAWLRLLCTLCRELRAPPMVEPPATQLFQEELELLQLLGQRPAV